MKTLILTTPNGLSINGRKHTSTWPHEITISTSNTYKSSDIIQITIGNGESATYSVTESYTGMQYTCLVFDESQTWNNESQKSSPTKQRKTKHKGQKYKPTALDRLNQSKQAKRI